ncbi:MAG: hypothetical protein KDA83_12325 [Planctomycetales bacterium]|nr:hypothetical protein [Planctomycetales bacterium]
MSHPSFLPTLNRAPSPCRAAFLAIQALVVCVILAVGVDSRATVAWEETDSASELELTDPLIVLESLDDGPTLGSGANSIALYASIILLVVLTTIAVATFMAWLKARLNLRRLEGIRKQLVVWGRNRAHSPNTLHPVPVLGPEALGWNIVLEHWMRDQGQHDGRGIGLPGEVQENIDRLVEDLPDGFAVAAADGSVSLINTPLQVLLREFQLSSSADTPKGEREASEQEVVSADLEDQILADVAAELASLASDKKLLAQRPTVDVIEGQGPAAGRFLRVARHPRWDQKTREFLGTIWQVRDITQQKLAEKMRDEFLDSATHELRTPLANIKAYAETLALADVLAVEQQKEFCNTINAEATRLARLIDDLLSISSMEVGSLSVNCQRTEVDRMLREVVQRVKPSMDKKNQKFHVFIEEKIPEMKLDKDKFSTVLVNLLGNASKYTPEEGNVTLRARVIEQALLIDVEDTGLGIAPEELPRVFEKFFRSHDPRVQSENGTGLGLSLTQELVRLHGGQLTVRSQLNQGSCFTIRMPL